MGIRKPVPKRYGDRVHRACNQLLTVACVIEDHYDTEAGAMLRTARDRILSILMMMSYEKYRDDYAKLARRPIKPASYR